MNAAEVRHDVADLPPIQLGHVRGEIGRTCGGGDAAAVGGDQRRDAEVERLAQIISPRRTMTWSMMP